MREKEYRSAMSAVSCVFVEEADIQRDQTVDQGLDRMALLLMGERRGSVGIKLNSTDKSEVEMVELLLSPRGSKMAALTLPRDELMR